MTDEERYIAQGRARDAAKKLQSEIATLRVIFENYIEMLKGIEFALKSFLAEPTGKAPTGRPWVDLLNADQRKMAETSLFYYTGEFIEKSLKLQELEKQIAEF